MVNTHMDAATTKPRTPQAQTLLPCHGVEALPSSASPAAALSAVLEEELARPLALHGAAQHETQRPKETRSQASRRRTKERERRAEHGEGAGNGPGFQALHTLVELRGHGGRPLG